MTFKITIPINVANELDKRLQTEHWMTIVNSIHSDMTETKSRGCLRPYPTNIRFWFGTTQDSFAIMCAYLNPITCPEALLRDWVVKGGKHINE